MTQYQGNKIYNVLRASQKKYIFEKVLFPDDKEMPYLHFKILCFENFHTFSRQKQDKNFIKHSTVQKTASTSKPTISCNEGKKRVREMF
jgi:hypothetical protein